MILRAKDIKGHDIEITIEGEGRTFVDTEGRIVLPAFYDMHSHLENAFTLFFTGDNNSSSLEEAVEKWSKVRDSMTIEDIKRRIEKAALIELFYGTTHIRVHADTCSSNLKSVKAALLAKQELADYVDLQIVAFPEQGIDCNREGFVMASKLADLVGGKPEADEDIEEHLRLITGLAERLNKNLDVHIDQHDDKTKHSWKLLEYARTHVALSHLTSLHFYSDEEAMSLMQLIKKKKATVISSPLTAFYLNGGSSYPMPRGVTRIKDLVDHGINVCLGHDDILNAFYPSGRGDMLQVLWMAMNIERTFNPNWISLITINSEKEFGNKNYDYVILDAKNLVEAFSTLLPRWGVIRKGRLVAKNSDYPRVLDQNPYNLMRELMEQI